ncbi:MAG: helix-turn-helix domain-containing protein, partial [Limosilactobacillus mucosae]
MLGNDTAFTLKTSYDRKRAIKMFLDNLSTSVLKLCDTRRLSYEAASERCDLSSRYFADIARGKTAPTILTLEKLCVGFDLTPNDLLIPSELWREMAFREP